MARSMWKGIITFGMVSIPVKLYTATESGREIAFNQLHEECMSRIKYVKWCPTHEREVSAEEIAKGYEYGKDQYVIVTDEDLENLPLPSKHTIALSAFVDVGEIDPLYLDKGYYLEPDPVALKPYALLMRALKWKGQVGIAKITLRNREQLCALRPVNGSLILHTLHYADQIREESRTTAAPDVLVSQQELDMAFTLIDMLSAPFEPERYQDDYREALAEIIQAKVDGAEIVEVKAPPAKVVDLMAALRASVEAVSQGRGPAAREASVPASLQNAQTRKAAKEVKASAKRRKAAS